MKCLVFSLFLLFVASVANAKVYQLIEQNDRSVGDVSVVDDLKRANSTSVQFHIKQIDISDAGMRTPFAASFKDLKFNKLKLTSEVGLPALPYFSIIVRGYPEDFEVTSNIWDLTGRDFEDVLPLPSQKEKMRCKCDNQDDSFDINLDQYFEEITEFQKIEYLGMFRGIPLTRIIFYPSQFIGEQNILRIYPRLNFNVSRLDGTVMESFKNVENIVRTSDVDSRFLIVSPAKFISGLEELINWKKKLGYKVDVVELESIGNKYEQIRDFFHARYKDENTKYTYALIVGDEYKFPVNYVKTSASSKTPSDLSYFTMDGGSDYIPEVFYGRLVVNEVKDVVNHVKKIIEYEKGDFADASGLKRAIGIASNEGSNPSDIEYVKQMLKPFVDNFGVETFYFFQSDYNSTPANVNDVFSKGVSWFNYIGHGSGTSWPSMKSTYRTSHIANIIPNSVKPVIIDVACKNGGLKYGKYLGERFMNAVKDGKPSGAVAYYGGSVNISWHPPAIMAVGINGMVIEKKLTHLGDALFAGQMYLYDNYSNKTHVKDNFTWYHLQGDPTLMLRIGDLKTIKVEVKGRELQFNLKTSIKVVFVDIDGNYSSFLSSDIGKITAPESATGYSVLVAGYKYLEGTL